MSEALSFFRVLEVIIQNRANWAAYIHFGFVRQYFFFLKLATEGFKISPVTSRRNTTPPEFRNVFS